MYLLATGGNTQGTHDAAAQNGAVALLFAIGKCSTISQGSFFYLNEVTSAGSLAAFTQFFSPVTRTIGSPGSALGMQGLANAFAMVPTLVDRTAGVARGLDYTGFSNTLPDTATLNTLADVQASCINSGAASSGPCQTLFTNAVSPLPKATSQPEVIFPKATDTLQAQWYMFANPSDGDAGRLNSLYGLVAASAPFQPTLASQPTDWTVALTTYTETQSGHVAEFDKPSQVNISPTGYPTFTLSGTHYSGWNQLSPSGEGNTGLFYKSGVARHAAFDSRGDLWEAFAPLTDGSFLIMDTEFFPSVNAWTIDQVYPFETASIMVPDGLGNLLWLTRSGTVRLMDAATILQAHQTGQYYDHRGTVVAMLGSQVKDALADVTGNLWVACAMGICMSCRWPRGIRRWLRL